MSKFKKFTGTYCEIVDALHFPPAFYTPQTSQEYIAAIKADINRTPYVNFSGTVEELKSRLLDITSLDERSLSYTQGDFDGGVFSTTYVTRGAKYQRTVTPAHESGTGENFCRALRIAYTDDAGKLCAFALTYLRDDEPTPGEALIPLDERKRFFVAAIIKNVNLAPDKRDVVFICHKGLLDEENPNAGEEINESKVPRIIAKALNSKKMRELLSGLIVGDTISLEHFLAINARVKVNQNIDNRDVKRQQLTGIMLRARESLPYNRALEVFFEHIRRRSVVELNFFRDEDFNSTLRLISSQVGLIKDYQAALTVYRGHLEKLKSNATTDDTRKFYKQGVKLVQEIETIVQGSSDGLDGAELSHLSQVLKHSSIAIDNPKDADNLKKLLELSQTVSGKASPLWKGLGSALLVFTGLALACCGYFRRTSYWWC